MMMENETRHDIKRHQGGAWLFVCISCGRRAENTRMLRNQPCTGEADADGVLSWNLRDLKDDEF